jgi:hypothetical protein
VRLTAVDAQMYWMSAAVPSDQFLLYAFDGATADVDRAVGTLMDRARGCEDLGLRIDDAAFWTYPVWQQRPVGMDQFVVHDDAGAVWPDLLAAVTALVDDQLDAREMTWRLHIFPAVEDVPGCTLPGAVVVVQICHALGDGIRSSALAAHLLGRDESLPAVVGTRASAAMLPVRGIRAARAHRRLVRETGAGLVPPPSFPRPLLRTNARPTGARKLRVVVRPRRRSRGAPTVTVGVLSAISGALAAHLRALGDDPLHLGAEVPMANSGSRHANNHFGNVTVGLYPDLADRPRESAIAADLQQRRRRSGHAAMLAERAALAAVPAPVLRWGVGKFDPDARAATVSGNTVVSSVNRGACDLRFGGAPVVLTTGLPGLSPMMGVTHGVHGIGDTVAVSVHAAESAMDDIDSYIERLEYELR